MRWTNEWDNLDGTVERGYGGRSIFFENGKVLADLARAKEYARLLASLGINGCTINNVNTDPRILDARFLAMWHVLPMCFVSMASGSLYRWISAVPKQSGT